MCVRERALAARGRLQCTVRRQTFNEEYPLLLRSDWNRGCGCEWSPHGLVLMVNTWFLQGSSVPCIHGLTLLQGYIVYETTPHPRTLQYGCLGPYAGPRGGVFCYERGTPVVVNGFDQRLAHRLHLTKSRATLGEIGRDRGRDRER